MSKAQRPHVVIVGAGFGGLAAAQGLRTADVDVTLIDKRNHHLFQPLLYQVATAGLSPADIAAPIRGILKRNANTRVVLDRVYGVDTEHKRVILGDGEPMSYDWLVLATGARHSYFGHDDWAPFAPGIKTIEDATAVRRKVLMAMERAETETDPDKRHALLTFVIIGGGPTGVEMAGAIAELARQSVSKDFRSITPHCAKVILIEGGERLLGSFPAALSAKAKTAIEQLGVEVRLGQQVMSVDKMGVMVGEKFIAASTAIWAAGVQASRAAEWLGITPDRAGRVPVGCDLRAPDDNSVFVIGDTAACLDSNGKTLPGVAPVAKQQGAYVAQSIIASIKGRSITPFRYRNYGNLATIGRNRAVADFGRIQVSGHLAWLLWCVAHIWFLSGYRNRFVVGANWLWNYLTFTRGARLITGEVSPDLPATLIPRPHCAPSTFEHQRKMTMTQNLKKEISAFGQTVLVFQGGGALGAYQVGVYQALQEAGIEPDWVIGTSIGAINAALIAGNAPGDRLDKLREFWRRVEHGQFFDGPLANMFAPLRTMSAVMSGIPGFFKPNPLAFMGQRIPLGAEHAGYYSVDPLRDNLTELVDFDLVNSGPTRLTVGAANVQTSEMHYFDSRDMPLDLRHVMASGALPPAFPAVRIDGELYWDGGIVSNTPVEAVFDDNPRSNAIVFAVHLWNPHGTEPQSIWDVTNRQKDVQYSSRGNTHIKRQRQLHKLRHIIQQLAQLVPPDAVSNEDLKTMRSYGCSTTMHVVRLLAPQLDNEDHTKDVDFSPGGIRDRWEAGYAHTSEMLANAPWRAEADPLEGFVLHEAMAGKMVETPPAY